MGGLAFAAVAASIDTRDLHRAQTMIPRAPYKGETPIKMSETLNGHMVRTFPNTKPCEQWTVEELQEYQSDLYHYREPHFDAIYQNVSDNRRLIHDTLEGYQTQWSATNQLVKGHNHLKDMQRDGHCHEAVMWLVHHVSAAEQQTVFATHGAPAPLLPLTDHADTCSEDASSSELEVCKVAQGQRSCADCHSGTGIIMQDYSDPDGVIPDDPKLPGWARQRRCDQNYLPLCGPCGGIGGPYWGDDLTKFQPTNCDVVALPDDVPVADRILPQFAEQFIVHLQSEEQRATNVTGPMVSLLHGLLGYGKYLGGLTCLADPVGVPTLGGRITVNGTAHSSFMDGADYKGRISIGVEYDGYKMGDAGHGDMKAKRNMTVDHYSKWFLHMFMDADKSSPTYGQPVRFYGPYSGFAVYVSFNKTVPPAEVWDTACVGALNGWPSPESKPLFPCEGKKITSYPCMVVGKTHPEVCDPWVNDTSTALEVEPEKKMFDTYKGAFGTVRIPIE